MAEPFWEGPFRSWVRVKYSPCPEELLSGLSDPQQPTTVAVEQEDGSTRQEFSRYWPAAGGGSLTDHRLSAHSLVNRYAGLYTGRMRALVQDQLGRGGAVHWDFRYARTHGIYTASDDSIWVIEISNAGISAALLSLCPFEAADTVDGISTRARAFPSASAITIASAAEVAAAYTSRSALWPESGWAFSDSGAKACNVVIGVGAYMVAYLHEITITETTHTIDGESVQGPGSASMATIDEGYFWGNRATHVRVPRYPDATTPQSLVSIDWFRGQIAAPSANIDTPIHAYYDGETRVETRYLNIVDDSYTHTDGSTGTSKQHGFETVAFPTVPTTFTTSGAFTELNSIPDPTTYYALHNAGSPRAALVLGDAVIEQTLTGTWTERSNLTVEVLTIPFGDRESVYHVRRTRSISSGSASATAAYDWLSVHYKESNTSNSHTFEHLGGCSDNAVLAHPDPIVGGSVAGHIVWDEAKPAPDPLPTGFGADARFGERLQENALTYWMSIGADCDDMVGGSSPSGTAEAGFNKLVELGEIDDDVYEFAGVSDAALTDPDPPYNARWAARWTGLKREISTGIVSIMPSGSNTVRAIPLMYISATSAGVDKRALYTHGSEAISDDETSFDFGVALGTSPITLSIDNDLWEELRIYDPSANVVQRLLVVARDASSAARQLYSEQVYPTMGTPIGSLLAGTAAYPLASVTAPQVSWIGKP